MHYDHKTIDSKWQKRWLESKIYAPRVEQASAPKKYILDMFPYPSAQGLHVGHPLGYIGSDIYSRFYRMKGATVLHPMGWDAFGLPAENYAIKTGVHPHTITQQNIANYRRQLQSIGFSYDWDREVDTTDPKYYKWTQWIFLQIFKKGLAYESHLPINWCPSCKTGLANEEVVHGNLCERCKSVVEQRPIRQWVLKITEYAEALLQDLDTLTWPEHILEMQRNWIGKSEGCTFGLKLEDSSEEITVFTTRIDTAFGMSFVAIAPEHPLVEQCTTEENMDAVTTYAEEARQKSQMERTELNKEKTGVFTGSYAINPFNGEKIAIYVCDYVLGFYGTGAVMGAPAHDERDFSFAKKHDLEIKRVIRKRPETTKEQFDELYANAPKEVQHIVSQITVGIAMPVGKDDTHHTQDERNAWISFLQNNGGWDNKQNTANETAQKAYSLWEQFLQSSAGDLWLIQNAYLMRKAYTEDGTLMDSDGFTGLTSEEARTRMSDWVEAQQIGKKTVNYKLRDWNFSRQRYWGEPIPLIHCATCGIVPVPEKDLPILLPEVEKYEPTGTGDSPLATIDEWVNTTCPTCHAPAKRETNTMPQWAGSCWYYLRYIDPHNDEAFADKELLKEWLPVDMYVGGAEHAVLHLLYARFWHKVLYDLGHVPTKEPFQSLKSQGLMQGEDGQKMSKSIGNVVNPDDTIAEYGADTLRTYEMFMGPFEASKPWSTSAIEGTYRFLQKVWKLQEKVADIPESKNIAILHQTIQKVTQDIENFSFNTAVSSLMILTNALSGEEKIARTTYETLILLLAPFAPHMVEELWESLGNSFSIHTATWPAFDPSLAEATEITISVQVNGKLRGTFTTSKDISKEEAIAKAKELESVLKYIEGGIKKEIYVPGKIVSLVV